METKTATALDIENDEFTLTDITPGAVIFYAGEPHTITKVIPLINRLRMPYEGVKAYDSSGWGHTILALDCEQCGVVKCFPGFEKVDKTGWFRLYTRNKERFFHSKECLLDFLDTLD